MSTPVILFSVWALLVVTTPINPVISKNPFLTVPWYVIVMALAILAVSLASARKGA